MKISVLTDNLQKKLSLINHAVTNKQLPILSHILLEAKNGQVHLTATDLEIGMQATIPAEIEEEGIIAIPSKLFSELITNLPQEKIMLRATDTALEVVSKNTKSVLQTMNRDEFPSLYEDRGGEIFSIKPELLKKSLSMVVFSASLETTRPALSGVYMTKVDNGFVFVATDGYRLSLKINKEQIIKSEELKPLIIPARVIREVLSLKDEDDIQLFVLPDNNQLLFTQETTTIVGRLIEAEFPNYQKIIPTDASAKITVDREELQKAVKTCSIFAREAANIITFSLQKDRLIISAKTPSLGENSVDVEAQLVGEENEIAFNAKYVLDVLGNVTEPTMVFEMTGPLNPGVFKIANDDSYLHVIMPIRT
jgi:DNA polymerase III subunit beta